MNSERIERLAVTAVEDSLNLTGRLIPDIDKNDRTPSWDGEIRVYNNKSNESSELRGRVPVQVKGKLFNLNDNMNFPEKIKYSVKIHDLKNYYNDFGSIFFVVYLDDQKNLKKIYYLELLPFNLAQILKDVKQSTIKLEFFQFPEYEIEKVDIFFNFLSNKKYQANIRQTGIIEENVLKDKGMIIDYVIPCTSCSIPKAPSDLLFAQPKKYVYANTLLGKVPLHEIIDLKINSKIRQEVTSGGISFYPEASIEENKDTRTFSIGNNIKLKNNKKNNITWELKYTPSGSLSEQINDLEFLKTFRDVKKFQIGTFEIPLDIKTIFNEAISFLEKLRELEALVKEFGIENVFNIDLNNLSDQDNYKFQILVDGLIYHKPIDVEENKKDALFLEFNFASFSLLVLAINNKEGKFLINNFFKMEMQASVEYEGTDYPISKYTNLNEKHFINCININYDEIINDIQKYKMSKVFDEKIIHLILQMLSAYDKQTIKSEKLLNTALNLSKYLSDLCFDSQIREVYDLNYLQCMKRIRILTKKEKLILCDIIEKKGSILMNKVAAAILLLDFLSAKNFYNQLSKDEQKQFSSFPIANLWDKRNKEYVVKKSN